MPKILFLKTDELTNLSLKSKGYRYVFEADNGCELFKNNDFFFIPVKTSMQLKTFLDAKKSAQFVSNNFANISRNFGNILKTKRQSILNPHKKSFFECFYDKLFILLVDEKMKNKHAEYFI